MKKLALLCMALVVALALCGAGFAYFSDTEVITATITAGTWDVGGSIGFWKNWDKHNTYREWQIEDWLGTIDGDSDWLVPDMDGDGIDIGDMEAVLQGAEGGTMEQKFLAQYLATRLNMEAHRLWPDREHDITTVNGDNYLDVDDPSAAKLSEIVHAIESKYLPPDAEDAEPLTNEQFEIMKDICEALNELEI